MELKKSLGQHFLHDENMLLKIAHIMGDFDGFSSVLEIGPGHGALTKHLLNKSYNDFKAVEVDKRCVEFLSSTYPNLVLINQDFLKLDIHQHLSNPSLIVGNFPYNISSQIVFKIIDHRDIISMMVGMFQKEVALRIAAPHNSKVYGVISILTQAYYDCEYLLDVPPGCFSPPPKVMSGIIKLTRREEPLGCDELLFKKIVKQSFTQRRKVLSNSLKGLVKAEFMGKYLSMRPEQLSVNDFVVLTNQVSHA
jgi:16S rRNA (adenine1518-N6/adenine1519-N6)-dimethyltransferase